jgi:CHAD domain-containing protein
LFEREVKLSAPAGFRWPAFGAETSLVATPLGKLAYQTVYFDTLDLRLARWSCSLRHRSGEGWTLKLPAAPGAGHAADQPKELLTRGEYAFDGEPTHPPADALALVAAYLRGADTRPVARLRTVRNPVRLDSPDGTPVAEMVLDEVSVMEGRRVVERFREIEVEVGPQTSTETLRVILDALRAAGAMHTDPVPKYSRALGIRALVPPEVVVGEISADSSAGQLVRHAIASSVDRYLRHEPGVRIGEDPEAVHQARVATRRLRSDLRTFAPLLEESWAAELQDELRWLGGLLGGARDADVLYARLKGRVAELPESDRPAGTKLVAELSSDREKKRGELLAAMNGDRYFGVVQLLVDAARAPRLLPQSHARASEIALPLLRIPWKKLRSGVKRLDAPPPDQQLHDIRIRAKRCRYAAEALAPVLGKPAARFAAASAGLQEVLGEHHDAVVTGQLLRERGTGAQAEVAFAAGELAGLEQAAAAKARAEWPAAWKRVRKAARKLGL